MAGQSNTACSDITGVPWAKVCASVRKKLVMGASTSFDSSIGLESTTHNHQVEYGGYATVSRTLWAFVFLDVPPINTRVCAIVRVLAPRVSCT